MAAAGTCLCLDDVADALVSFMRTLQGCEASVAQVLERLSENTMSAESDGKEVAP
jgi:cell division septum initiation protein DivIVA